jgi:hypothetical protein
MPSLTPRVDSHARNIAINGGMDLWQRGTSFAAAASGQYTADRFRYNKAGTMVHTVSQSTDVPTVAQSGFQGRYSLLATVTTAQASLGAGDVASLQMFIEGYDYAPLHSRTVRYQFMIKASVVGVYSFGLRNASVNRSYVGTYTVIAANTWEKKFIDIPMDTSGTWLFDNGRGLIIDWSLASGSTNNTSTLNTWQAASLTGSTGQVNAVATNGSTWQITQFMIVPEDLTGLPTSVDLPFQRAGRTIGEEILFCQRYCVNPAGALDSTSDYIIGGGQAISTTLAIFQIQVPVDMRVAPLQSSATVAADGSGKYKVSNAADNGTPAASTFGITTLSPRSAQLAVTVGSGLVAGNAAKFAVNVSQGAKFLFEAEL